MKRQERDRILGQSRGIGPLILVKGGFNIAHYGVLALLVLYMARQLLMPSHAEHVWGQEVAGRFQSYPWVAVRRGAGLGDLRALHQRGLSGPAGGR